MILSMLRNPYRHHVVKKRNDRDPDGSLCLLNLSDEPARSLPLQPGLTTVLPACLPSLRVSQLFPH